ncbi:hypothetical protein [Nakamurella leprariae]|uniref:Uncharacterized protein n=1 Tax=Nakamurella leprariae TaxID=2803911 RepID=A0A939C1I4_9ACTN|nr:hypothetical protein [Nakamurella leprariae]MBM9467187.1 hypothetical protein [Nakamurella leprariae]
MTSPHDPGSPADRPDRDPATTVAGHGEPIPTDSRDVTVPDDAPAASAPTDRTGPTPGTASGSSPIGSPWPPTSPPDDSRDEGDLRPFGAAEPGPADVPYRPDDQAPPPAFAAGGDPSAAGRWDPREDSPSPFKPGPSSFPAAGEPEYTPESTPSRTDPEPRPAGSSADPSATTAIPASEWAPPDSSGTAAGQPSGASGFGSSADSTATSQYPAMTVAGLAGTTGEQDRYGRGGYAPPAEPMVVPARVDPNAAQPPGRRDVGGRTVAGLISAVLGLLLVGGGLYLVGEFGSRIAVRMLDEGVSAAAWDVVLTAVGALLVLGAVVLNGWSPWATLLPGVVLVGAGIWSIVAYDGADRIAGFLNRIFSENRLIGWGVTGWVLVLGAALLGASCAAMIARAAGRTRGRP